jgi:hypothetical protein
MMEARGDIPSSCSSCGIVTNIPGQKFCGNCGCDITASQPVSTPQPVATPQPTSAPKKRSTLPLTIIIILTILGLAFLAITDLRTFFYALQILSIGMMFLSALVVIRNFKKPKKASIIGLSVMIISALISFMVFTAGQNFRPMHMDSVPVGFVCGLALGFFWSFTNGFVYENKKVKTKGNAWYIMIWALVFCLTQLIPLITGRPPDIMAPVMAGSMGMMVTNNGMLIFRIVIALLFSSKLRESGNGGQA